jgi:uncharacterized membrane protein YgcG
MPLDGLRAWVAEVERKLGKRTRVFLALCVISIGIAGAAVYLAIDARNSSVSESDVQELQRELEERIDAGAAATAPGLGTPPESTLPEPTTPEEGSATPPGAGSSGSGSGTGSGSSSGSGSGSGGGSSSGGGAGGGSIPSGETGSTAELKDLLDQAKRDNERIEREEGR